MRARPLSVEHLKKAFEVEFVRYCERAAQGRVCYSLSIEGGTLGDRPHIHALISGTSALGCGRLEDAWRHGRAEIEVYDPAEGAARYLVKEIGGRVLDYDVSRRAPPTRQVFGRTSDG